MNNEIDQFVNEYIYEKISYRVKNKYEGMKRAKEIKDQASIYSEDRSLVSLIMNGKIYPKRNKYLLTPTITPFIIENLKFGNCLNLVWGSDQDFDDKMQCGFGFTKDKMNGELWELCMLSTENELDVHAKFAVNDVFPTERDFVLYELTKTGFHYLLNSGDSRLHKKAEKALKSYAPFARSLAYGNSELFQEYAFEVPEVIDPFINPDHINGEVFFRNLKFASYLLYKKYRDDILSCHESFFKEKGTTKINNLIKNFFNTVFLDIFEQADSEGGEEVYRSTLYYLNLGYELFQTGYIGIDKEELSELEKLQKIASELIDRSVDFQLLVDKYKYRSGEEIASEFGLTDKEY